MKRTRSKKSRDTVPLREENKYILSYLILYENSDLLVQQSHFRFAYQRLSVTDTEYTQWQRPRFLAYVPSWWKNYPRLVRVVVARHTPFHYIYHHIQSCGVRSSWEDRYTPPISTLLCGIRGPLTSGVLDSIRCVKYIEIRAIRVRDQSLSRWLVIVNNIQSSRNHV